LLVRTRCSATAVAAGAHCSSPSATGLT
jgi:hypothetical protein